MLAAAGERPGGVCEEDDLLFAILAIESFGDVAGTAAAVAPAGTTRTPHLLQPEPVRELTRPPDRSFHRLQQVGAKQPATEQRPEKTSEVVRVGNERTRGPDIGGAANADVQERPDEVTVRVRSGDARSAVEARRAQVQRHEDAAAQLTRQRPMR